MMGIFTRYKIKKAIKRDVWWYRRCRFSRSQRKRFNSCFSCPFKKDIEYVERKIKKALDKKSKKDSIRKANVV